MGWMAMKTSTKDDTSPVRAAAVNVLVRGPDPATARTPSETTDDKSWIVRVAALEAVARRGDPSMLNAAEEHTYDPALPRKIVADHCDTAWGRRLRITGQGCHTGFALLA